MKAPDRIFVPTGSLNAANIDFNRGETRGLVVTAGSERWYEDDEEYIRKGAFPVADLEAAIRKLEWLTDHGRPGIGSSLTTMRRILSLLESDDE